MLVDDKALCPCCSGIGFKDCCAPLLSFERRAETAEQLMRSRYCAFSIGAIDYLIDTLAPERRSSSEARMLRQELRNTNWTKLEILDTEYGTSSDQTGVVEFNAYFEANGRSGHLHERSNFRKEGEQWIYVDGKVELKEG